MDISTSSIEDVTVSDILDLATWNRPRSDEELHEFITRHHAALPDNIEIA